MTDYRQGDIGSVERVTNGWIVRLPERGFYGGGRQMVVTEWTEVLRLLTKHSAYYPVGSEVRVTVEVSQESETT